MRNMYQLTTAQNQDKMNSFAIVAFFAAVAATGASVIAPSAKILQGPSSKTTLVGPEGSVISSVAPGGQVITEEHSGVVAYAAPAIAAPAVVSTYATHAAPVISAYSTPVVSAYSAPSWSVSAAPAWSAYSAPAWSAYSAPGWSAHSAPVVSAYSAPLVAAHGSVDTVVSGPSGTIAASRGLTAADVAPVHGAWAY